MKKIFLLTFISIYFSTIWGQNNRLNTYENIGWYALISNFKLNNKFGLNAEYHWRRDNFIKYWQQSTMRVGVNYQYNPRVLFRMGYTWIETFPYGEIPINGLGRDFTEHRIFEMVQLSHKEDLVDFSHRFMLEQRFVGRYSSAAQTTEDEFPFWNRMRYMMRLQVPLRGREMKDKTPYFAFFDEILIGFGKNVNANIFDQNRVGLLLGYRFNKNWRLEGGYINQTVQFGRFIGGRPVFQHNNGLIMNFYANLDLQKKEEPKN